MLKASSTSSRITSAWIRPPPTPHKADRPESSGPSVTGSIEQVAGDDDAAQVDGSPPEPPSLLRSSADVHEPEPGQKLEADADEDDPPRLPEVPSTRTLSSAKSTERNPGTSPMEAGPATCVGVMWDFPGQLVVGSRQQLVRISEEGSLQPFPVSRRRQIQRRASSRRSPPRLSGGGSESGATGPGPRCGSTFRQRGLGGAAHLCAPSARIAAPFTIPVLEPKIRGLRGRWGAITAPPWSGRDL
jgi:hypothetical protein